MKNLFKIQDKKEFVKTIQATDIASFESGIVHEVYSTFALTRDAEWSGRLFVLDMKEDDEEGIGTMIQVFHKQPAFVGETVRFESFFERMNEHGEMITTFKVYCGERLIAEGKQGQKILKKEKIQSIFSKYR